MGLCQCNVTGHGTDSEMFATRPPSRVNLKPRARLRFHMSTICAWCRDCVTSAQVTAEEFAEKLGRQASKSKAKTGEVMINVDVIETILLEAHLFQQIRRRAWSAAFFKGRRVPRYLPIRCSRRGPGGGTKSFATLRDVYYYIAHILRMIRAHHRETSTSSQKLWSGSPALALRSQHMACQTEQQITMHKVLQLMLHGHSHGDFCRLFRCTHWFL